MAHGSINQNVEKIHFGLNVINSFQSTLQTSFHKVALMISWSYGFTSQWIYTFLHLIKNAINGYSNLIFFHLQYMQIIHTFLNKLSLFFTFFGSFDANNTLYKESHLYLFRTFTLSCKYWTFITINYQINKKKLHFVKEIRLKENKKFICVTLSKTSCTAVLKTKTSFI